MEVWKHSGTKQDFIHMSFETTISDFFQAADIA